jgi:hypothetical protein
VWLAFMLMLTTFHHPKAKMFYLASILANQRLETLFRWQAYFFFSQESSPNKKVFALG